jgi:hypothetical protein
VTKSKTARRRGRQYLDDDRPRIAGRDGYEITIAIGEQMRLVFALRRSWIRRNRAFLEELIAAGGTGRRKPR